jgi:5'-nucleotidase
MLKKISSILFFLAIASASQAQDITILYSGETHAMLYPCNCPIEPDGGVSRRATLVKYIRKDTPNVLLVDSGGFFAGGLMDGYTQNTELDMLRSLINLKAMELMQYDAATIADDEFNFGRKFLEDNIAKTKLHFLSANMKSNRVLPYIIKEIGQAKIGVIGVTSLSARQKSDGLEFSQAQVAVKQAVSELKGQGVNLILVLSHLGETEDLRLIQDINGIDIVISGHSRTKEEISTKINQTIILRPSWQGRSLGRLSLTLENNRITKYKAEELRLSDKLKDDPDIQNILPECFSDLNCKKEGLTGACQNPGSKQAQCIFSQPQKVNLVIITPKVCNVCNTEKTTRDLKSYFPGLSVSYLYYPDEKAKKLIEELGLRFLPAYLLGRNAEREKSFDNLRENLILKGEFYIVKPQLSGMSYLLDRTRINGKLDLVLRLYDKQSLELLETIKEFKPDIHFLAIEREGNFEAGQGKAEVEEYLRAVCMRKYYPQSFFDYISCRAKNINSSWWEDCLGEGLEASKIKTCARSPDGRELLRQNINLNKELGIMSGPTYLVDNQEIFSTQGGVPKKEEFKKLFGK